MIHVVIHDNLRSLHKQSTKSMQNLLSFFIDVDFLKKCSLISSCSPSMKILLKISPSKVFKFRIIISLSYRLGQKQFACCVFVIRENLFGMKL